MQKISTNQKPGLAAKKLSRFSSHPLLAKRKAVRISDDHFSNSYLFMAPKFQNADLVFSFLPICVTSNRDFVVKSLQQQQWRRRHEIIAWIHVDNIPGKNEWKEWFLFYFIHPSFAHRSRLRHNWFISHHHQLLLLYCLDNFNSLNEKRGSRKPELSWDNFLRIKTELISISEAINEEEELLYIRSHFSGPLPSPSHSYDLKFAILVGKKTFWRRCGIHSR